MLFAVSLILLLIAITLISHTIRLSIYSKRFTVRTMQLVGATQGFVMKPFIKTFMTQGFIAAVIALILITITLFGINDYLPDMNISQNNEYIVIIYISVIILSLLLTMLSTIFSMRRYLNADIDRFYM